VELYGNDVTSLRFALAWSVHLYTAFGAVLGFRALIAVFAQDYRTAFFLLAAALAIDSSDGALARAAQVKQVLPWFDGELLDNIVDYLCYVVVPAAILVQPGILPPFASVPAMLVLIASGYGFCRTDAKGVIDHYFQGFPSYWNVMVFYFVALSTSPVVNLVAVLTGVALVFVPLRWLYPSRMERMRGPTIALGVAWAVLGLVILAQMPDHSPVLAWISLFYPAYYTIGSVIYHLRTT
jgi:phosphatidylcholine synthase